MIEWRGTKCRAAAMWYVINRQSYSPLGSCPSGSPDRKRQHEFVFWTQRHRSAESWWNEWIVCHLAPFKAARIKPERQTRLDGFLPIVVQ
jgi:hypothetical protein